MNKTILTTLLGSVFLISCGGGAKRPNQDPQGFWQGSALDNRIGWGMVQPNGRYLLILSGPNGNHTLETVQTGTMTTVDGSRWLIPDVLTVTQRGFPFSSEGDSGGAAEFMTRSSWTGRIDGSLPLVEYQLAYVNDGVQTSSLSALAGTYNSWPIAASAASSSNMTIDANGAIAGNYFAGCTYTGQAATTSQANVFNITLQFVGTCYMMNSTVTGMLYHDAAQSRIYAAAVNAVRTPSFNITGSFMFVGPKN